MSFEIIVKPKADPIEPEVDAEKPAKPKRKKRTKKPTRSSRKAPAKPRKKAAVVETVSTRCPKCGSSKRGHYTNVVRTKGGGMTPDGLPFTHVTHRRTRCAQCGQVRIDRSYDLLE